jgi:hypothetical protein
MKPDALISEARAKIVWGDTASSVREFLTSKGMSATDADVRIKELSAERNAEIRKIGIRSTLIGVALVIGAGILLYVFNRQSVFAAVFGSTDHYLIIVLGGLYGVWKIVIGVTYLVRPQFENESLTEIEE